MIEVIKKGSLPTYEIKCPKCNSILHFTDTDEMAGFIKFDHMICCDWDYCYIICPICGHQIITREEDKKKILDYRKLIED